MLKTVLIFSVLLASCTTTDNKTDQNVKDVANNLEDVKSASDIKSKVDESPDKGIPSKTECSGDAFANVTNVSATGSDGDFQFSVTIKSPDEGCDQYANWWEVLDENGKLVYRRILAHSHVDEQPFTRSGGPVDVNADAVLFIRAHMNPGGYGSNVFKGSVKNGFLAFDTACDFAASVDTEQPIPASCAF